MTPNKQKKTQNDMWEKEKDEALLGHAQPIPPTQEDKTKSGEDDKDAK